MSRRHASDSYQPGVCNIGPAEIAWRRRLAWLGALATVVLAVGLIVVHAPPLVRLVVVGGVAAGTAVDYLQVRLRFCAGFAARGVFNFGPRGSPTPVSDRAARTRDLVKAAQLVAAGGFAGLLAGAVAALIPA